MWPGFGHFYHKILYFLESFENPKSATGLFEFMQGWFCPATLSFFWSCSVFPVGAVQTICLYLSLQSVMLNITQVSVMETTTQFPTDWPVHHVSPPTGFCCPPPISLLILLMAASHTRQEREAVQFSAAVLCNFYTFLSSRHSKLAVTIS